MERKAQIVTLYTVSKESIQLPEISYGIEMNRYFDQSEPHVARVNEEVAFAQIKQERIPVEEIHRNTKGEWPYDEVMTDVSYIAVEPELKELFSLEWRQKYNDTFTELCRQKPDAQSWRRFLSEPWYRRVWRAIRNKEYFSVRVK